MSIVKSSRAFRGIAFLAAMAVVFSAPLHRVYAQSAVDSSPPAPASVPTTKKPQTQQPKASQPKNASVRDLKASPTGDQTASLLADQQRQVGRIYYADGNVDLIYENMRLRADHVEYNEDTQIASAHGHVQLDYLTQHVEADDAVYELQTGKGKFHHMRATFAVQRRPSTTLLISPNPIYFEAEEAERIDRDTYKLHKSWMTVCDPDKPTWKFYAPEATIYMQRSVHLENGNFRLFSVPVLYLPYATFPAEKARTSGFLIPDVGESSSKGYIMGESVYWAPTDWADVTLGANYYSRRGWAQKGNLRMRPWENARLDVIYSGVIDRGLEQGSAPPINQGGHEVHVLFTALLPDGWRAVADLDQLQFAHLPHRVERNVCAGGELGSAEERVSHEKFSRIQPEFRVAQLSKLFQRDDHVHLRYFGDARAAPEVQFGSVDQAPWAKLPIYFSFEAFSDAVHRGDTVTGFSSPNFMARSEIAPTVTMPLHFGPWLDVTPSFTLRSTYYGGQVQNGDFVNKGFFRTTEELSVDLRPFITRSRLGRFRHEMETRNRAGHRLYLRERRKRFREIRSLR